MSALNGREIRIVFPSEIDLEAWKGGYFDDLLPDQWPYGLNRMAADVAAVRAEPLSTRDKAALVAGALGLNEVRRRGRVNDVCLAWEEQTAARMYTQYPGKAMFSGLIWASDMWESGNNRVRGLFYKRLLGEMAGIWCLSRAQVEVAERHLRARVPVSFLPFGIDQNFFTFTEMPERLQVLSVGNDRDRDPKTLFAALELVHSACPSVDILVQANSSHPVPPGITRINRVSHSALRELYRQSTVVVVATNQNLHASGMTVALEAGATGRPVVASNTPGMDDYVMDSATGSLVPPKDPGSMAQKIIELLNDRDQAAKYGLGARRHVEMSHTSENMVSQLERLILGSGPDGLS